MKIISGGQTGADQGGLRAARALGLETGGYAPREYRTEKGVEPWLKDYGLKETLSSGYRKRTEYNVRLANGTLLVGIPSAGSILTKAICEGFKAPLFILEDPSRNEIPAFLDWMRANNVLVLNVAGNRESVNPGIGKKVEDFLVLALPLYLSKLLGVDKLEE